jgi:hypothetical protein
MENDNRAFPEFPTKPYNKFVPRSQRTSGKELDEACYPNGGGGIPQAEGGMGLDAALRKLDGKK